MKLLLDLGNSRMKWAWLDRGELRDPGAAPHNGRATDDLETALQRQQHRPDAILVASVAAPALTTEVIARLGRALGAPVRLATTGTTACGVRNGYRAPAQLGVDRWLAMVAAFARYRRALCVVDAGTAVTVDAVTGDGVHLGGFIVPGLALMRGALLRETGRLEAAAGGGRDRTDDPRSWGRDTESCIWGGALGAIAGLVESCVERLAGHGVPRPVLVLTGGDAQALRAVLRDEVELRPLLVLEGLAATCGDPDGPPR